jgi:hypothetical protein
MRFAYPLYRRKASVLLETVLRFSGQSAEPGNRPPKDLIIVPAASSCGSRSQAILA